MMIKSTFKIAMSISFLCVSLAGSALAQTPAAPVSTKPATAKPIGRPAVKAASRLVVTPSNSAFRNQAKVLAAKGDDLGLRILLRKNFKKKLSITDWNDIRKILVQRPGVGFDVIAAWDRQVSFHGTQLEKEADKFSKILDEADEFALSKNYSEAFKRYQSAAQQMKKMNKGKVPKGNELLYLNVLHQMARTLYADKKYNDSLEVYNWIPPYYPQIRQVLYEKMWSAFKGNKYDIALGAIASQQSDYFSAYLNPESYLIKIYIFKKLCRKKDLAFTVKSIRAYLNDLKANKISEIDWAKSDLYYLSLAKLAETQVDEKKQALDVISTGERDEEIKKIKATLSSKYSVYKSTIQNQLERVLGYAALAISDEQDFLKPMSSLPETNVLEKQGYEMWPAAGAEEWLDEIGSHVFIGDTECKTAVQ